MHVTKIRVADESGLIPAGQYFARVAGALREANAREAQVVEHDDAREHKLEMRYRRRPAPPRPSRCEQHAPM